MFNLSSVKAKMENGLLNINIPYSPNVATEPTTITIK